jgi:phospholipid-transporting ATPase
MSDNLDFTRLVSLNNPAAASQYQPANTILSQNQPQLLDPFFDDEDDVPDSAFGRPLPAIHPEQSHPSTVQGVYPDGSGTVKSGALEELPQEWVFDDDAFQATSEQPFPGSSSFPGPFRMAENITSPRRKKWKWPWQKDRIVLGDRIVALNNEVANDDFCSNFVSTSKYNAMTFLPKFLTGTVPMSALLCCNV